MKLTQRLLVLLITVTMLLQGSFVQVFAADELVGSGSAVVTEEAAGSVEEDTAEEAGKDVSEKAEAKSEEKAEEKSEEKTEEKAEEAASKDEAAAPEEEKAEVKEEAGAESAEDNAQAEAGAEEQAPENAELKLVKQTIEAAVITEKEKEEAEKNGTPITEIKPENDKKATEEEKSKEVLLKGVMPEGANATAVEAEAKQSGHKFVSAYDITIYSDPAAGEDAAWQPESEIKVEISDESLAGMKDGKKVNVYHIADDKSEPEFVCETTVKDGKVKFTAESFSIYGIEEQNHGRIGYRFWYPDETGKYKLITTQYFKYDDVQDESVSMRLYSPKIPGASTEEQATLFKAWHKGTVDETGSANVGDAVTIDQLNTELVAKSSTEYVEGTLIDIIAELNQAYYITYVDINQNNILQTEFVTKEASGDTSFTVSETAKPTRYEDDLQGWVLADHIDDPDAELYLPGSSHVITSNITLAPVIQGGHWLIFNDNDMVDDGTGRMVSGGASFTPPQFCMTKEGQMDVTERPADPEWIGYEFGGWYKDAACTEEFTFGQPLTADTTVYAKWIPSDSSFTILIWKQRATDDPDAADADKTYDFVSSERIESGAQTGTIKTGMTVNRDSDFTRYTQIYGPNGSSTDDDKKYFTFNNVNSDSSVIIKGDGSTVMNIYYDRVPITMNFNTWQTEERYERDNYGDYGLVNGTYVNIDSDWWGNYYYLTYADGTPVPAGTTVYRRDWPNRWTSTTEPSYDNDYYRESGSTASSNRLTWVRYTGQRYSIKTSSSWKNYKTFKGLYGATLADRDYTWPTEYDWHSTGGNNGSTGGTRTTFLVGFLPTGEDTTTLTFYGSSPSSGKTVFFYTEGLDGSYSERNRVATSGSAPFNISDKYNGFHAAQYRVDGGNWNNVGAKNPTTGYYGSSVSYRSSLEIRFDRNEYKLNFVTNNSTGETKVVQNIPYETPLSSYANQNPGQKTGHYFEGWYADKELAVPFDFSTANMGAGDMTVFGKWRMLRTRVVIVPVSDGGPENVDIGSQALSFRLDYDEKVDGGLLENATRPGYILDGWYSDPEFRNKFLFSTPVNANTDGVDMTYQTAAKWNNARVGYGDDTPAYSNVRGILVLYARWIVDTDVKGTNLVYDAGEAAETDALGNVTTSVPIDANFYQDDATVLVKHAPTGYSDLYEFDCWEVINADGTVFMTDLKPDLSTITIGDLPTFSAITDEEGNEIHRTVKLRAKYTLSEEAKKRYTTLTYDGNTFDQVMYDGTTQTLHGRAQDGMNSQRVLVDKEVNETVVLPGDEDFYLMGYKLTGWSFTEGSNQAKRFDKDQVVYADNLDRQDEPLNTRANTIYAMWEPKTYSVTVKQVVEEGVSDNSFSYTYKYAPEREIGSAATATRTLTGDESFAITDGTVLKHYNLDGNVIALVKPQVAENKDYSVRVSAKAKLDDGTTVTIDPQTLGTYNGYRLMGDLEITITYSPKVEVTLAKRDAKNKSTVLTNAVMTLTPVEFNTETQHWDTAGESRDVTINNTTVTTKLQEGVYRVSEKTAPEDYAKISKDFYLTVHKNADLIIKNADGSDVSDMTADLSKPTGGSYKTQVNIYDNPIRKITLRKVVEGSARAGGFDFKITVSKMESDGEHRLSHYDIGAGVTNNLGELEITGLAKTGGSDSVELRIPDGYKLEIEEKIYSNYITSYTVDDGTPTDGRKCIIDPVSKNQTVVFTNLCIPAPTGYTAIIMPFVLMLIAAAALIMLGRNARRREKAEETIE